MLSLLECALLSLLLLFGFLGLIGLFLASVDLLLAQRISLLHDLVLTCLLLLQFALFFLFLALPLLLHFLQALLSLLLAAVIALRELVQLLLVLLLVAFGAEASLTIFLLLQALQQVFGLLVRLIVLLLDLLEQLDSRLVLSLLADGHGGVALLVPLEQQVFSQVVHEILEDVDLGSPAGCQVQQVVLVGLLVHAEVGLGLQEILHTADVSLLRDHSEHDRCEVNELRLVDAILGLLFSLALDGIDESTSSNILHFLAVHVDLVLQARAGLLDQKLQKLVVAVVGSGCQ